MRHLSSLLFDALRRAGVERGVAASQTLSAFHIAAGRLADASGALLTRYPEGLANALRKIGAYAAPMKRANNATAHLYISNPFGPRAAVGGITKLFMTHPPIAERIKALLGRE